MNGVEVLLQSLEGGGGERVEEWPWFSGKPEK